MATRVNAPRAAERYANGGLAIRKITNEETGAKKNAKNAAIPCIKWKVSVNHPVITAPKPASPNTRENSLSLKAESVK